MSRSVDWLRRQRSDPFSLERVKRGLNARSAIKLEQMDSKLKFLSPNKRVVDLGAHPGGWCQILLEKGIHNIVALDLLPPPLNLREKVTWIQGDFTHKHVYEVCMGELEGKLADVVLSDMAQNTTGNREQDHALQIELCRIALSFSDQVLNPETGSFLCKVFQGEEGQLFVFFSLSFFLLTHPQNAEESFAHEMKSRFKEFRRIKPTASRKESREVYYFGRNTSLYPKATTTP